MARGRFVSKAISLDEKVDALSDDTCRLLFTWLITHLDCEGRMHGDPVTVKSVVFPRRADISSRKIENCLKEMENFGLIFRYSVNGNQYLCMKTFEKHQPGLRKDRESSSQIPPIPPEILQSNDGVNPPQDKVKEQDKVQVQDKDSLVQYSPEEKIKGAIDSYQENILLGATIPEDVESEIKIACGRYSAWWVIDAIEEACLANHPDWGYIVGILKNWRKYGKKT